MPDVWSANPAKLKGIFIELGAKCGVEARVLKPRDPQWTCHIDSGGWLRDVYIHHYREFYSDFLFWAPLGIALILGIFAGLFWGRHSSLPL